MNEEHTAYIGTREVWGELRPVELRAEDRRQHVFVVGQTGTGKSTLLRNLILQDIYAGCGVGLIDPHGDLASDILDAIPPWRTDHVVYFNPADSEFPPGLNLVTHVPRDRRHLVASGVVSAFKNIWGSSWGPRLEYILYCCIAALLDCQNVSLLGVPRMLVDERYRRWVTRQIKDPMIRQFWAREFTSYKPDFLREAVAPVQNKVGQLLAAPPLRNVLGQITSTFDPAFIMDEKRIFIASLPKGLLGEDKANLLGSLLVTQFQLAAMARAGVPEGERQHFGLFIDEFSNFATESFTSILSESRKYGLGLTLVSQHTTQVAPQIRDAVFGNAGTIVSFRVGQADAVNLEKEFCGDYLWKQFTALGNHEILVRSLSDGRVVTFAGRTLQPLDLPGGRRDLIIRRSREKYCRARTAVEERIERWMSE